MNGQFIDMLYVRMTSEDYCPSKTSIPYQVPGRYEPIHHAKAFLSFLWTIKFNRPMMHLRVTCLTTIIDFMPLLVIYEEEIEVIQDRRGT